MEVEFSFESFIVGAFTGYGLPSTLRTPLHIATFYMKLSLYGGTVVTGSRISTPVFGFIAIRDSRVALATYLVSGNLLSRPDPLGPKRDNFHSVEYNVTFRFCHDGTALLDGT
jgi:hypothetical protein